jgi:hypothetical protein
MAREAGPRGREYAVYGQAITSGGPRVTPSGRAMSALGQKQIMRRNKSCPLYSQLRLQKRIFALRHVRFSGGEARLVRREPLGG